MRNKPQDGRSPLSETYARLQPWRSKGPADESTLPLRGRVILDCSTLLPGPKVGKLLADQGARVLKIENPERPDPGRDMGGYYEDLNGKKELVQLNLKLPPDRERFAKLVGEADGLIEGFRPAAKLKLGLDERSLHALNPKLCVVSLVGYPEDGPWRDRAGHDSNFQAVTGCLSLFRELPGLPLADLFAAYSGAFAMASMLDAVARGAPGRRATIGMAEALESMQSLWIREFRETGQAPEPGETLMSGRYPCYRLYRCADGRRVAVAAIEHKFWEKVCAILGLEELVPHGYATGPQGEKTAERVQSAFMSRTWAEWAPHFEQADCCVEPVLDYPEVYRDGL
jgi:crotonobetainyl-CoA:carnitine CoA-transferase CaiB-like acyl-CoA transferase